MNFSILTAQNNHSSNNTKAVMYTDSSNLKSNYTGESFSVLKATKSIKMVACQSKFGVFTYMLRASINITQEITNNSNLATILWLSSHIGIADKNTVDEVIYKTPIPVDDIKSKNH